jgi:hypothetical protein
MARYGLGNGSVLTLLREHVGELHSRGVRNVELHRAIELYQAGWSPRRIGAEFDCDAETVR